MKQMNRVERDQLIEEAAALADSDPRRQEILNRLDDEALQEWIEHRESYRAIRKRLNAVVPPAGLNEQLLLIPQTAAPNTRLHLVRNVFMQRWFYAAAAMVAMLVIIGGSILRSSPSHVDPFDQLVAMMVADHAKQPKLVVESSDPRAIEQALNVSKDPLATPPMLVRVPDALTLGEAFHLQGGRLCAFDTRSIAYTRWLHQDIEHSLYQVQAHQFSLPPAFERKELVAHGHRVVLWQEGDSAYGLVCPH